MNQGWVRSKLRRWIVNLAFAGWVFFNIVGFSLFALSFRRTLAVWAISADGPAAAVTMLHGQTIVAWGDAKPQRNPYPESAFHLGIGGNFWIVDDFDAGMFYLFRRWQLEQTDTGGWSARMVGQPSVAPIEPQGSSFPLVAPRRGQTTTSFDRTASFPGGIIVSRYYVAYLDGMSALLLTNLWLPRWTTASPLAISILICVWISVRRVRRLIVFRRKQQQRCVACGYDLTGNASGVCPECGVRVAKDEALPA
jgi:hypothetical protein